MKISLCLLTMDRYEVTKRTLEHNFWGMENTFDCDWELLWADQGSTDKRVIPLVEKFGPTYSRLNSRNEGVAKSQNQLMLRSTGDFIMFFPNDILLPNRWLDTMIRWHKKVPNAGLVGIECTTVLPEISVMETPDGPVAAHFLRQEADKVFGVMFFSRDVVEKIGAHHDGFDVYGLEDSDWNHRIRRAGFTSFYIPNLKSEHIGGDIGEKSEYRKIKDESMHKNHYILWDRVQKYDSAGYFEPWPEAREPL